MREKSQEEQTTRIVARCVEEFERVGETAIKDACRVHPELETVIRAACSASLVMQAAVSSGGRSHLGSQEADKPWTGKSIGRFRIEEEIGRGGMGRVFRAFDSKLERTVALKLLPETLALSAMLLERFRREGQALAQTHHPHIVPIFDVAETEDGIPYLAMKFIEGSSLESILQATAGTDSRELRGEHLLPKGAVVSKIKAERVVPTNSYVEGVGVLVKKIADALEHAHRAGIVHRDVKPANILVDLDGEPTLVDFGIARAAQATSLTQAGTHLGTPEYMAPEQVQEKETDPRTDIYSLGATLYRCLTRRSPFKAKTRQQTFERIKRRDPILPSRINPEIPVDLERICLTAMEKDPARRYQSAAELRDDLERFLEYRPVAARPIGRFSRAWRTARRNPMRTAVAVLSFLLAVGGPTLFGLLEMRSAQRLAEEQKKTYENLVRARAANAESSFLLARRAAQRGRWQEALAHYDNAERLEYPDRTLLGIGRIEAWEGNLETLRAMAELDRLRNLTDVGGHRAKLLLLEADLGVNRLLEPDAGLNKVREALEVGGLSSADEALARAMLAGTVEEALAHIRTARASDPYNRRANDLNCNLLLMAGDLDKAVHFAGVMQSLYPEDPNPLVYAAFLEGIRGRPQAAQDLIDEAKARLSAEDLGLLDVGIDCGMMIGRFDRVLMDSLVGDVSKSSGQALSTVLTLVRRVWPAFLKKRQIPSDAKSRHVLYFRIAPVAMRNLRRVIRSFIASMVPFAGKDRLLKELATASDELGDGIFQFLRGHTLVIENRLREAERAFELASKAPSIAISRRTASFFELATQFVALTELRRQSKEAVTIKSRMQTTIGRILVDGDLRSSELATLHRWAMLAGLHDVAVEVAGRWYRVQPQEAGAKKAFGLIPAILRQEAVDTGK